MCLCRYAYKTQERIGMHWQKEQAREACRQIHKYLRTRWTHVSCVRLHTCVSIYIYAYGTQYVSTCVYIYLLLLPLSLLLLYFCIHAWVQLPMQMYSQALPFASPPSVPSGVLVSLPDLEQLLQHRGYLRVRRLQPAVPSSPPHLRGFRLSVGVLFKEPFGGCGIDVQICFKSFMNQGG